MYAHHLTSLFSLGQFNAEATGAQLWHGAAPVYFSIVSLGQYHDRYQPMVTEYQTMVTLKLMAQTLQTHTLIKRADVPLNDKAT